MSSFDHQDGRVAIWRIAQSGSVCTRRELMTRELSRDNKFLPAAAPTTRLWLLFLHGSKSGTRKAGRARKEAAYEETDCCPAAPSPPGNFPATAARIIKPGILRRRLQSGKPHLPVEARLVRNVP